VRILCTGDKGFVGLETRKVLEKAGHTVIGYDLMDGYDIRDRNQLNDVVIEEDIDRILHLAAIARFADADKDPQLAFQTNVEGTKNVVAVAKMHKIPLVYASTGSVYMPISEHPPITEEFAAKGNSVYGCTKYLGETYVKEHTPHIILRYAHLYGAEKRNHGLIGGFLARIDRGLAPTLYGGKQSNDFTYIKDVALANKQALEAAWDAWNQAYNIGSGEELSAAEAGRIVCEAAGYTGAIDVKEGRTVDAERFFYDTSKAEKMLGFKAQYSFKQGLEDMFQQPEDPRFARA
jgi:nucleoside-diphosphate-sugar epimerase